VNRRARSNSNRRRRATALLLVGACGLATASAASVGGLTPAALGADNRAITSCDTNGITLTRGTPTYNPTVGHYVITTIRATGVNAACRGRTLAVTVANTAGVAITSGAATIVAGGTTVTFATSADIKTLTKVAAVIY